MVFLGETFLALVLRLGEHGRVDLSALFYARFYVNFPDTRFTLIGYTIPYINKISIEMFGFDGCCLVVIFDLSLTVLLTK